MKSNNFCGRNASQRHHLTFQISTKSCQAFPRYEPSKIDVSFLFFFSFHQGVKVVVKHKSIT